MEDRREVANKIKSELLDHIDSKINKMLDEVTESPDDSNVSPKSDLNTSSSILSPSILSLDKRKSSIVGKLPEKVFQDRDSPLTELLAVPHFKTIHHIFLATLTLFMIHSLLIDLLQTGKLDFGMESLLWAFGQRQTLILLCLSLNLITIFVVYPTFHLWATYRQDLEREMRRRVDLGAGGAFILFILSFIFVPMTIMIKNPLPPASGAAVTMEQCRLLMKVYAFVRTAAPRVMAEVGTEVKANGEANSEEKENGERATLRRRIIEKNSHLASKNPRNRRQSWINWNEEESAGCPGFSKYIYFLLAPTLIYKDSYPMRKTIRWDYVCWNFAQCLGCIVYANFMLSRFLPAFFANFGQASHQMNLTQLVNAIFSLMLPGTMCLVLAFFLILHAVQNAFAEILCFGDRLFYKDWWNCTSFATYYKTWNLIVYDWLYTYVFKDACEFGLAEIWRPLPTTLVFFISSLFHEYILCFAFNFFFPVLLTLFGGFGFAFVFVKGGKNSFGNVLMWMALISGTGIILALYTMEYYARINCPPAATLDFFKPRALTCGAISWSLY